MTDDIYNHFSKSNWDKCETETGTLFYKLGTNNCVERKIECYNTKKESIPFKEAYQKFLSHTEDYFKNELNNLQRKKPINIYNGYNKNSFVSTGLEIYYPHLYNDARLCDFNTYIIQPSVRFKLDFFSNLGYNENTKYDYSSIAFNNLSIVETRSDKKINDKIEIMIGYLSKIGIHASRVKFFVSKEIKEKENGVRYFTVKFFVDNLEIGDILFINTKNNNTLIEFGFGLERLLSRYVNRNYSNLFLEKSAYEQKSILYTNFLTAITFFDESSANRGAKSHINKVIDSMSANPDCFNINLIYENYLYWKEILSDTDYMCSFDKVTNKYINMTKKRRR